MEIGYHENLRTSTFLTILLSLPRLKHLTLQLDSPRDASMLNKVFLRRNFVLPQVVNLVLIGQARELCSKQFFPNLRTLKVGPGFRVSVAPNPQSYRTLGGLLSSMLTKIDGLYAFRQGDWIGGPMLKLLYQCCANPDGRDSSVMSSAYLNYVFRTRCHRMSLSFACAIPHALSNSIFSSFHWPLLKTPTERGSTSA